MAEERVVIIDGEEEEKLLGGGVSVLDFDVLCSAVAAMQNQGNCKWGRLGSQEEEEVEEEDYESGGGSGGCVFRMWEGDVVDWFDDCHIAIESACCPCYRFEKNMRRASFGLRYIQAIVYLFLAAAAVISMTTFIVTSRHFFLYMSVVFTISLGAYMGFHRMKMRKKFNIRGTDSFLDDCLYHLVCPCCTLSQESRTLEMNNVQNGTWHGRGDTLCIGAYREGSGNIFELRAPPMLSVKSSLRTPDHVNTAALSAPPSR